MPGHVMSPVDSGRDHLKAVRMPHLAERVVFAGGLPGCGKTLLTPIVSSFEGVELQKYDYPIEHVLSLDFLGNLRGDAASALLRMWTDVDLYNLMMSREVNFRFSDLSSVFRNPHPWRYVRRLFQKGDAAALERARIEKPILHIQMHNLLAISRPLFRALRGRLRVIELVRHPLYMIKQWHIYMHRYGTDVRSFGICFDWEGRALPFFAKGWEERYLESGPMDRAIYSINALSRRGGEVYSGLSEDERRQVLIIPFERFVIDPMRYVSRLGPFLGSRMTSATKRAMKKQRVPRKRIADGINLKIYRQFGWEPPERKSTERDELAKRRKYVEQEASPGAMEILDRLSREYEETYLKGIL